MNVPGLPTSVDPLSGEALDHYLTRVAFANGLTTREFTRIVPEIRIRTPVSRASPYGYSPDPVILSRLAELTGQALAAIRGMTLGRYTRGSTTGSGTRLPWKPTLGMHLCPLCISDDLPWQVSWRLPHATLCVRHSVYLRRACPACDKPYRSNREPLLPTVPLSLR